MTPKEYLADVPENCTALQLQELWKEKYAGRRISWTGELTNVRESSNDRIIAHIAVSRTGGYLHVHAEMSSAQKSKLLHFSKYDRVTVSGFLPSDVQRKDSVLLINASLSDG